MKIEGDKNNITVTYSTPHGEWKSEKTVLSVDQVSAIFKSDGSVALRSKDGRLEVDGDFVLVHPGWYDPNSEMITNTKAPIFRNQVACCYELVQKSNNRKGYLFSFKEPDNETTD